MYQNINTVISVKTELGTITQKTTLTKYKVVHYILNAIKNGDKITSDGHNINVSPTITNEFGARVFSFDFTPKRRGRISKANA